MQKPSGSIQLSSLKDALRKVVKCRSKGPALENRQILEHVLSEAHEGTLGITWADRFKMAQVTVAADWSDGR